MFVFNFWRPSTVISNAIISNSALCILCVYMYLCVYNIACIIGLGTVYIQDILCSEIMSALYNVPFFGFGSSVSLPSVFKPVTDLCCC